MVEEVFEGIQINNSELFSGLWSYMPDNLLKGIDFILRLGKIVLVAFIVYIAVLILIKLIKLIFGTREHRDLKSIFGQLNLVNNKLEQIIELMKGKHKNKIGKNEKIEKNVKEKK